MNKCSKGKSSGCPSVNHECIEQSKPTAPAALGCLTTYRCNDLGTDDDDDDSKESLTVSCKTGASKTVTDKNEIEKILSNCNDGNVVSKIETSAKPSDDSAKCIKAMRDVVGSNFCVECTGSNCETCQPCEDGKECNTTCNTTVVVEVICGSSTTSTSGECGRTDSDRDRDGDCRGRRRSDRWSCGGYSGDHDFGFEKCIRSCRGSSSCERSCANRTGYPGRYDRSCEWGRSTRGCVGSSRYDQMMYHPDGSICYDCSISHASGAGGVQYKEHWLSGLANVFGAVAPPLFGYLGQRSWANAYQNSQQSWANAYSTGLESCNAMKTNYIHSMYGFPSNEGDPRQIGFLEANNLPHTDLMPPECNGMNMYGMAGMNGMQGGGMFGVGNSMLGAGYSPGFMSGMYGPYGQYGMQGANAGMYTGGYVAGSVGGVNLQVVGGFNGGFNGGFSGGYNGGGYVGSVAGGYLTGGYQGGFQGGFNGGGVVFAQGGYNGYHGGGYAHGGGYMGFQGGFQGGFNAGGIQGVYAIGGGVNGGYGPYGPNGGHWGNGGGAGTVPWGNTGSYWMNGGGWQQQANNQAIVQSHQQNQWGAQVGASQQQQALADQLGHSQYDMWSHGTNPPGAFTGGAGFQVCNAWGGQC